METRDKPKLKELMCVSVCTRSLKDYTKRHIDCTEQITTNSNILMMISVGWWQKGHEVCKSLCSNNL